VLWHHRRLTHDITNPFRQGVTVFHVLEDGTLRSSLGKQVPPEEMHALAAAVDGKPGDCLLLAVGDRAGVVRHA